MNIALNLDRVRNQIGKACVLSNRSTDSVDLMLVTKTVLMERILPVYNVGHRLFGENRIQEVVQKWTDPTLQGLKPEFIGHLQTNKVKVCLDTCGRIHSVDRMGLVDSLDRELQKRGEQREILLQVNTSSEASKYGVSIDEAISFAKIVSRFQTLKVTGLMTLAVFSDDTKRVKICFKKLRELSLQIQSEGLFGIDFCHLSMGMSSDFAIAVEEGATIVRVGTAVFGDRPTSDSYYWPEESNKR